MEGPWRERNALVSQTVSALPALTLSTLEPVTEVMIKMVIVKSVRKSCSLDPIPTPFM